MGDENGKKLMQFKKVKEKKTQYGVNDPWHS